MAYIQDTAEWTVPEWDAVTTHVSQSVQSHMQTLDPSHDFSHIQRVCRLASTLFEAEMTLHPDRPLCFPVIHLACLIHDLEDHKYPSPVSERRPSMEDTLVSAGCGSSLVEALCSMAKNVSYSREVKDSETVAAALVQYPELGIVQDADRLDALGAVGIGRAFAYGGANGRELGDTVRHFGDKLEKLALLMKTKSGKRMAEERAQRVLLFKEWFEGEWDEKT